MKLLCITGPTSSGKTALSLKLAQEFHGEIINADARQLYLDAPIGTGVPSEEMRASVPHHLFAVSAPDEVWTVSRWCTAAHEQIKEILARGHMPIVVGGTGLYVRALTEGYVFSGAPDRSLRAELLALSEMQRVKQLLAFDASLGAKLDLRNPHRVLRALERLRSGVSLEPTREPTPYTWQKLAIHHEPETLRARVAHTIQEQFARGWVDEVRALLERGVSPDAPLMTSIGFRAIRDGLLSHPSDVGTQCISLVLRDTWQYVRRQMTWFRKEPHLLWAHDEAEALDKVRRAR